MLTAGSFFKVFFGFFDFGRTSTAVRLCAFMSTPSYCLITQANDVPVKLGDATGTPDLPFVGAFLLEFDNACVTHLGEAAEKTRGVLINWALIGRSVSIGTQCRLTTSDRRTEFFSMQKSRTIMPHTQEKPDVRI